MCRRFTNTGVRGELAAHFGVAMEGDEGTGRYNIAASDAVLAIALNGRDEASARLMRWGIPAPAATYSRLILPMINARSETAVQAFPTLISRAGSRVLILADGWYEWGAPTEPGAAPRPYHFRSAGGEPFAFAGLWREAIVHGEPVETALILTRSSESVPIVREIHSRMPVALDRQGRELWLDTSFGSTALAIALCHSPMRIERRAAHPSLINTKDDGAHLLDATV